MLHILKYFCLQKAGKSDPITVLKKQLEDKERSLQEGMANKGIGSEKNIPLNNAFALFIHHSFTILVYG
jgi:hypothetical protein